MSTTRPTVRTRRDRRAYRAMIIDPRSLVRRGAQW